MSIDRQRSEAVKLLETLGYVWRGSAWMLPNGASASLPILEAADKLHGIVMDRAAVLTGCAKSLDQQIELARISDALQKYEVARRDC